MSMRYFTLSAVCMLIFCMLLALSGTTDFPASHDEIVSPSSAASIASGLSHSGVDEAMAASVVPLPEDSEPLVGTGSPRETAQEGSAWDRPLLFLGMLFVGAWIVLSFRMFSNSKN